MIKWSPTRKPAIPPARFSRLKLRASLLGIMLSMLCAYTNTYAIEETLSFYVDSPSRSLWQDPTLTAGGWVWGGFDDPIERVALESGGWSEDAGYGGERGDVAIALGIPAAVRSGFRVSIEVHDEQVKNSAITIAAYRASGKRVELKTFQFVPSLLSKRWKSWLDQYPQWKNDLFWVLPGSSGVSDGNDYEFKATYRDYQSETLKLGLRVPLLYMRTTLGQSNDWEFTVRPRKIKLENGRWVSADWLQGLTDLSIEKQLPILFTLNGGVWGDAYSAGPEFDLIDYLELDSINCQWDQLDTVHSDGMRGDLPGSLPSPELSRMLTLNALNKTVRYYKKRNLQAAGRSLFAFSEAHPHLFAGINLDADLYLSPFVEGSWHDFNPDTLKQFRQWLAGQGLYSDEGELASYREQSLTLQEVNRISDKRFATWQAVDPPREAPVQFLPSVDVDPWMHLWERFRRHLVDLHYDELSQWLVEVGIPKDKIFSSQAFIEPRKPVQPFAENLNSPVKNYDSAGVSIEGAKPRFGHLGAILYGQSALNNMETESGRRLFNTFYQFDPDWAIVEHSVADFRDPPKMIPTYAASYRSLRESFNYHAQMISPMAWNGNHGDSVDQPGFAAHTAFRGTPMESALKDFLREYAFLPRRALLWSFGNGVHSSADGWVDGSGNSILWPESGKLRWHHPAGEVNLHSPAELALMPSLHKMLVIDLLKKESVDAIAVDYRESQGGWLSVTPMTPIEAFQSGPSGISIPLDWSSADQPKRIRLRIEMTSSGENMIDHIAILPTGQVP